MTAGAAVLAGPPARPPDAGGLPAELLPVEEALRRRASATARSIRADAEAQAEAALSQAGQQASAITDRARRDGRAAARGAGAARTAAARRQARETVLAARRASYTRLRSAVIAAVQDRIRGPAGRPLRDYLAGLVGQAAGGPAVEASGAGGGWQATAEGPHGTAALDVEVVVDQVLQAFAEEIARLWN
ncbi:MAG TPA: hypothetical protein VFN68_04095 [Acidimicrobiales bacterium]|nr:hypothetical protein [Acidimicrobiales bacterium]